MEDRTKAIVVGLRQAFEREAAHLIALADLLGAVPDYLEHGDPQEVNKMLHLLVQRVLVQEDGAVMVEFK